MGLSSYGMQEVIHRNCINSKDMRNRLSMYNGRRKHRRYLHQVAQTVKLKYGISYVLDSKSQKITVVQINSYSLIKAIKAMSLISVGTHIACYWAVHSKISIPYKSIKYLIVFNNWNMPKIWIIQDSNVSVERIEVLGIFEVNFFLMESFLINYFIYFCFSCIHRVVFYFILCQILSSEINLSYRYITILYIQISHIIHSQKQQIKIISKYNIQYNLEKFQIISKTKQPPQKLQNLYKKMSVLPCYIFGIVIILYSVVIYSPFIPSLFTYIITKNKNNQQRTAALQYLVDAPTIGPLFYQQLIMNCMLQSKWQKVIKYSNMALQSPINHNSFSIWYHKATAQCILSYAEQCQRSARIAIGLLPPKMEKHVTHLFNLAEIIKKNKNFRIMYEGDTMLFVFDQLQNKNKGKEKEKGKQQKKDDNNKAADNKIKPNSQNKKQEQQNNNHNKQTPQKPQNKQKNKKHQQTPKSPHSHPQNQKQTLKQTIQTNINIDDIINKIKLKAQLTPEQEQQMREELQKQLEDVLEEIQEQGIDGDGDDEDVDTDTGEDNEHGNEDVNVQGKDSQVQVQTHVLIGDQQVMKFLQEIEMQINDGQLSVNIDGDSYEYTQNYQENQQTDQSEEEDQYNLNNRQVNLAEL